MTQIAYRAVHVVVLKYADHLPLYRHAQIYSRQEIDLDRATLAAWGEDWSRSKQAVQRTD